VGFRVAVADSAASFEVADGETVLAAAQRADVPLAHDCQLGGCGTCRVKLVAGAVTYAEFPFALTEEEASAGYALACQAQPASDLIIAPARAQAELPAPERRIAFIDSVRALSPLVTHLALTLPDCDALDFRPGQYMNVLMPGGATHSFSMASAPRGNRVDFHVRRLDGGRFTDAALRQLKSGDALEVELPLGSFLFRAEDYRPLIMVATGTGLAPIKAMLEALMDDPDCPPVSLYWGARTQADLYLHDEIAAWGERLYEFAYVPVLSRAHAAWSGRRGYVQSVVPADIADLSEHAIYLCGSPEMIVAAKQAFIARGASLEHIYSEGFTKTPAQSAAA